MKKLKFLIFFIEQKQSLPEPADSAANRQNPKRYSKIRKGFTGYFSPEDGKVLDLFCFCLL